MRPITRANLHKALQRYFDQLDRLERETGFPANNTLSPHWSPGAGGSRVLMRELSPEANQIQRAINSLEKHQQEVVFARYGLHQDENGRFLTLTQKAEAIGLTVNSLNSRWKVCKKKLLVFLA